jgi:hypothetical protein
MKFFIPILLFFHGAIHLIGFVKAFKLTTIEQISKPISETLGIFWLLTFIVFLIAAIAYISKQNWWCILAIAAILLSTILIISVWQDAKFGMIPNVIILLVVIIGYANVSFHNNYQVDVQTALKQTKTMTASVLTELDIAGLPEPVQKYIRYAGYVGKPKVNNFKMEFSGGIRKNAQSEWMQFTTEQYNFVDASKRLFYMNATMNHIPLAGYHCFKNGIAYMDIRLLSMFKVQYMAGKEMNIAETVTFFNDMCCMAPATLIDKRIKWLEVKGNNVKVSFTNNNICISALLYFNDNGELINFVSNDRFALSDKSTMKQFPWSTPLKDYKVINGHKLASYAEMIYSYPEGDFCYGTFKLKSIEYNAQK